MYVGFVELPLYKPHCWHKWFSTMPELILEGTTYPRGTCSNELCRFP